VLADLEATWKPWQLTLVAVRALVVGEGGRVRSLAGLEKRADILSVPTSELRIETGVGSPIVLFAVPTFVAGAVEIAVVAADKAPAKAPHPEHGARDGLTTGQANVAVQIPVSFANEVLRRLTWTQPLTVPVDREEIDIQNVSLAGQGAGELARLTLTGNATPKSVRETMRWTVVVAGEPLRVSSVQAAAQLEGCAGLGTMAAIGCNVRNGARAAAAETFAAALTQKYQGQFVHDLASPQSLRFNVAGQRIDLRGDLVKTLFSARGLSAAAHLDVPSSQ